MLPVRPSFRIPFSPLSRHGYLDIILEDVGCLVVSNGSIAVFLCSDADGA